MTDVVVIGKGPAGISAAVYALRAGLTVQIIGKDTGALAKASEVENYYGFTHPVTGEELTKKGEAQALRLGASILEDEVVGIGYDGNYIVHTQNGDYSAPAVVMATGSARNAPRIKGLKELEGRGVSYCAVCDGFFYRGKPVAVLGAGEYALHEAQELLPIAAEVTLLTNGAQPKIPIPEGIALDTRPLAALEGGDALERIRFQEGEPLEAGGLFVAVGVAGSADLARKLGAEVEGARIKVDERMHTSLPGLFAAGDCTGGMLQIAKAVYEGAMAGTEAIKYVRQQKRQA